MSANITPFNSDGGFSTTGNIVGNVIGTAGSYLYGDGSNITGIGGSVGATGATGIQGNSGATGVMGFSGATGPQGTTGDRKSVV